MKLLNRFITEYIMQEVLRTMLDVRRAMIAKTTDGGIIVSSFSGGLRIYFPFIPLLQQKFNIIPPAFEASSLFYRAYTPRNSVPRTFYGDPKNASVADAFARSVDEIMLKLGEMR